MFGKSTCVWCHNYFGLEWQVNLEEFQQNGILHLFSTTWNIFVVNVHVDFKYLGYMYVDELIHSNLIAMIWKHFVQQLALLYSSDYIDNPWCQE